MNNLLQVARDAWLAGLTIDETVRASARLLTQKEYMIVWIEWHECERQFGVAEQIIRSKKGASK